jgi:phytoene dehydrogenase-like protein
MSENVVVGGGISGLVAATFLARRGARVTLVERSGSPGGRACSDTAAGCALNRGPHALYRGGPGAAVLAELGVEVRGSVPPVSGEALYGGTRHILPTTPTAILRTTMLSGVGRWQLVRAFGGLRWLDTDALREVTLRDWLSGRFTDPAVIRFFETMARLTTYASDPEHLSAGAALAQLQLAMGGVLYLEGGWQSLVDGLLAAAESAGVRIRQGQASGLVWSAGALAGVALSDGEVLPASACVLAVGPAAAGRLLGERAPDTAGLTPTRASCLDLVLSQRPPDTARLVLGVDEPLYLSVHTTQPAVVAHALRYLGPGESPEEGWLEARLDVVWPGWRQRVLHRRYLPALIVSHASPTVGSVRPAVSVPGCPEVCLAGDWVGDAGCLADAALSSARQAAALLAPRRVAA